MTPWQEFVNSGQLRDKEMPVDARGEPHWDWRARLPSWVANRLALGGHQGWDMVDDSPPFVMCELTEPERSREMASSFDDIASCLFHYRDWTSNGTPFVREGEVYWSGFWFERISEAVRFHEQHGGAANWLHDFEERRRAMNAKRDGEETDR